MSRNLDRVLNYINQMMFNVEPSDLSADLNLKSVIGFVRKMLKRILEIQLQLFIYLACMNILINKIRP